mmetsp:Transcript_13079/g.20729  ORF Transcript_13079/g.20729 Transcript_13079/m.20729 type:complete len:210 (+) Transcript_13079:99-728(+)
MEARSDRHGAQIEPAKPARPDRRNDADHMRRAFGPRGRDQLADKHLLDVEAALRGHVFGDEHARGLPDLGIDRRLHEQHIRRHVVQNAALRVAQHVAVDAAARRGRQKPDAGQDLAEFMHDDPAALRGVILVEFHPVGLVDVPVELVDEDMLACPEVIDQKLAVIVHVRERQAAGTDIGDPCALAAFGADPETLLVTAAGQRLRRRSAR